MHHQTRHRLLAINVRVHDSVYLIVPGVRDTVSCPVRRRAVVITNIVSYILPASGNANSAFSGVMYTGVCAVFELHIFTTLSLGCQTFAIWQCSAALSSLPCVPL